MAVRKFTLPVEPNNEQVGQIAIIVDPATGYSPTVNSAGALKVQTDATIELGDVQIKNKAGTAVIEPATDDTLLLILAKLIAAPATQATLAAVLAKLSADPATQTTLAAVLAKLSADPATQTTLAAVLAKLSADASTATLQGTANTALTAIVAAAGGGIAAGDPTVHTLNAGANTVLLAASATRESVVVTNMSASAVVYVSAGDVAESTKGIPLGFIVAGGVGEKVSFTGAAAKLAINALCASAHAVAVWAGSTA